ncbi:hypothetical protein AURDEDRAFT_159647 [Auricularia subglabra TFB-10046 SS5]|nr:hypothetical protein AURDEDRAFT_159647 [Auricularia subglabra TFB-10046 SS5]
MGLLVVYLFLVLPLLCILLSSLSTILPTATLPVTAASASPHAVVRALGPVLSTAPGTSTPFPPASLTPSVQVSESVSPRFAVSFPYRPGTPPTNPHDLWECPRPLLKAQPASIGSPPP